MTVSPDEYRRASGYRRSTGQQQRATLPAAPSGPVQAFTTMDFDSPEFRDFVNGGREAATGVVVGERLALRNSAFFRAVNLIASSIGMLPTHLHRRKADGTTDKAKDHPLYRVLHKRPNRFQTAFEFKSYMQTVALLDGNAYARIVWGLRGGKPAVLQLIPMARGTIEPILSDDWVLTFRYRPKNGATVILQAKDVFHFRHPISKDGLKGLGLLDVAFESLGLAATADRALAKLMSTGMMAGGAIQFPDGKELDDEAFERLRASLRDDHSGADNSGSWLLLEDGAEAKPFATPESSQTDETVKRQVENLARFTDVPRPLLMMDETSWGSGIRELGLFLVTYCLTKWFVAWEQAIERSCLTEAEQDADELYVKFNDGALLRGSLTEQAAFYSKALGNNGAWMEPNEVRAAFELNPHSDGSGLPKGKPAPAPKEAEDVE